MTLKKQTVLLAMAFLTVTVVMTFAALTFTTREVLIAKAEQDGMLLADIISRSSEYAREIPDDVEETIGEQMIVDAKLVANMVAIAEASGMNASAIISLLKEVSKTTGIDEFWITDEKGHAYLRNRTEIDFTFSPDSRKQPQAHEFWGLLTGAKKQVVQKARKREVDNEVYKYAGVGGVDKRRIVQVGYNISFLHSLREKLGVEAFVNKLGYGKNIKSIRVVDPSMKIIAAGGAAPAEVSADEASSLRSVLSGNKQSEMTKGVLTVMLPVKGKYNNADMAIIIEILTGFEEALKKNIQYAAWAAAVILLMGGFSAGMLSLVITRPVELITEAASDLEKGVTDPEKLNEVTYRKDELGQLGRVFQKMEMEVRAREEAMKARIHELNIQIDEAKKEKQVAEITDTDYFHKLQERLDVIKDEEE